MPGRSWFFASQGQQQGPVPEAKLRELIAAGAVSAETLVWTEGMADWAKAGVIPGLLAGNAGPPAAVPYSDLAPPDGDIAAGQPLSVEFGIWELFGRGLLVAIGDLLVIPSPWAKTAFFRWFVAHMRVPQRPDTAFTGRPGDIWYAFVLLALGIYAGASGVRGLPYLLIPVQAFVWWTIVRWLVANLSPDGTQRPLSFTGGPWAYIGWYLLAFVSFFTIIGWAWVFTAWGRWMCRHVEGTRRQLTFNASGGQMLWRMLLVCVAMGLLIPVPWALAWFARWNVSQFALVERNATPSWQ